MQQLLSFCPGQWLTETPVSRQTVYHRLGRAKPGCHSCADELANSAHCGPYQEPTLYHTTELHSRVFNTIKDVPKYRYATITDSYRVSYLNVEFNVCQEFNANHTDKVCYTAESDISEPRLWHYAQPDISLSPTLHADVSRPIMSTSTSRTEFAYPSTLSLRPDGVRIYPYICYVPPNAGTRRSKQHQAQ